MKKAQLSLTIIRSIDVYINAYHQMLKIMKRMCYFIAIHPLAFDIRSNI